MTKMTEAQVAAARELRATGMAFKAIVAQLELDVEPVSLRYYCADIVTERYAQNRARPSSVRSGFAVRSFSAEEDDALIAWNDEPGNRSLSAIAVSLGRKRHSLVARLKSLQRVGRIEKIST